MPPHRPVIYYVIQLSGQPPLTVLFPSHQVQRGTPYQLWLVRPHPVVRLLPWIEMPPVYQISAIPCLGIRSPICLDRARCHSLHNRRFFNGDDFTVYQPGRQDSQPLGIAISQGDNPLSIQRDPNVTILVSWLQCQLWHKPLPPP
jgi:hypothetical protein